MKGDHHLNIYNILFPAESDFVGWVQFATLTKDKRMVSLGYSDFEHIEEKVKNTKIHKSHNGKYCQAIYKAKRRKSVFAE